MGENTLRFIINEVNKMQGTDYNMISFDSLPKNALLQALADCLYKLDAITKVDVERNVDDALAKILESLTNIKVPFPIGVTVDEFTTGIIQGKRSIIHSTLYWILTNQVEVTKRAYFAKYLKKITPPMNLLSDLDIQALMMQYENLIQEFKNIHVENTKYAKMGQATLDLRKDIEKTINDIKKVEQQIDKQKSKIGNIPNKESLFVSIRAYRSEVIQEKMLRKQLEEQNNLLTQLENEIKKTGEYLRKQQSMRLAPSDMIDRLKEELQTNRVITQERLPQEYEMIKNQLQCAETVAMEAQPTEDNITELQNTIDNASMELQMLMDKSLHTNDPKLDKLAQFRQHANVIANNKQLAADALMELKEELDSVSQQINEKDTELQRIVGGTMLQGEELKRFVNKLRNRSVVYKEHRIQLQELQAEVGTLERTQEILLQHNLPLAEALKNRNEDEPSEPNDEHAQMPDDKQELMKVCKQFVKKINSQKTEINLSKQELSNLKMVNEEIVGQHQHTKEIYESSTSNLNTEIKNLEYEVTELEKQIEMEENKWKDLMKITERKKDILNNLSEEIIQFDGKKKTQKDLMIEKVHEQELEKEALENEIRRTLADKENREQQTNLWHSTLEVLKCKLENTEK